MTSIREGVQGIQIGNQLGAEGIEVDVAHQLQEIGILLAEDGLVSVLEERAESSVAPIVGDGIAREEPSHEGRKRDEAGPKQEVGMVEQQGPGITGGGGFDEETPEAIQEMVSVLIVLEDARAFNSADDEVMKGTGCIEASLAGHGGRITEEGGAVKGNL